MKSPRNVLVVVPRRLGDVLLATPVIRSLKRAFPESHIDALVFSGTQAVLIGNPDIKRVWTIDETVKLSAHLAFAVKIFRRYDLALSLVPGDRSTIYAGLAGRTRIGLVIDETKHLWKKWLLRRWVAFDNRTTHTVSMHLRVIEALGLPPVPEVVFIPRNEDVHLAHATLKRQGITGAYAVLHPCPKFRYKRWHDQGWIELAQWLQQRALHVVITGGNDADERTYCAALAERARASNLAGTLELPTTAAVIAGAKAYVGPDTVVTHLAAALGVPTVALFGPGDPLKWGPWPHARMSLDNPWRHVGGNQLSGNVHIVQGSALCVPCFLEGCDRNIHSISECLTGLPARRVIGALDAQLTATRI